jgi:membrane-associated phospholipid phosphatase
MDRRARQLLILAAGGVALFGIVLAAAYVWGPGRSLDELGLTGFVSADRGPLEEVTARLVQLGDPPQVALMALGLALVAVLRARPRVGLVVLLLIAATSVSSQLLKALLAHPRSAPVLAPVVGAGEAFPSGHATAAMSLALAGVLAAPRRARPAAAALGSLLALGVGLSVVARGWHFPSDVLGGYLLATVWALVLAALLCEADRRYPATGRPTVATVARVSDRLAARGLSAAALLGAAGVLLLAIVTLGADPMAVAAFARDHTTALVVAAGVAVAALALPAALATLVPRRLTG